MEGYLDALRALDAWLRQWELQSLHSAGAPEKATLITLRDMLSELESRIGFFAHPHGDDPVTGWFPHVTDAAEARHVLALVRRAIRQIERMEERVRDHLTAVASMEDERRSRRVEMIGFLLLFPALIAGVFGANTMIPWRDTWRGFWLMLGSMVLLTGGAYLLVTARRRTRARRPGAA
jgi:Mg2+ and Co2+ transporter CorA